MSARRDPLLRGVLLPGVLALTLAALAGCSVEVVDDARTPAATRDAPRPSGTPGTGADAAPADDDASDGAAGAGSTGGGSAGTDLGGAATTGASAAPQLPTRDDLRPLTTGRTACGGGDMTRERAGDAVEVTDACGTLTVVGADSVVVAGDVEHLVVSGAGARVAVRSATTVTLAAAAVTVTWEDGNPVVTDDGPGSSYGPVDPG